MTIPKKVEKRLTDGLKRFQPIIRSARDRDVNESDTVVIIADMLAEIFGYDKYSEITTEFAIRGTYCDLAIKIDGKLHLLIEVKAAGLDLKESHIRQAIDYASNQGVDWIALTNGVIWKIYRVMFGKPIHAELVLETDLLSLNPKNSDHLESLYLLTREGVLRSALADYQIQKQALDKFSLAAIVTSDSILKMIRRELRKLTPGISIGNTDIKDTLEQDVLKREVVEGEKATEARKKVQRMIKKQQRATSTKSDNDDSHAQLGVREAPTQTGTVSNNVTSNEGTLNDSGLNTDSI